MFDSPIDRAAGLGHDDPVTAARPEHDAKFGDQLQSSAKKFSDSVNATRAGAKPDTAITSDNDSNSDSDSDK